MMMVAGCNPAPKNLIAGSKFYTESAVLGEILAQHVQNKLGMPVDRRAGLQGSLMAHQALISGEIDFYAEDAGTAHYSIFRLPLNQDLDMVNSRVALEYQTMKIRRMASLGYMSSFVVAASKEMVKASTLSEVEQAGRPVSMSYTMEFEGRLDGLAALNYGYKLRRNGTAKLVDPNLVADQVTQKFVQMGVVSTADPVLLDEKIKLLEDDKKVFASYPVAIVVRERTFANYPELESALKLLEGKLSVETLRKLNNGVRTRGKTPALVASEFLQQAGLW